MDDNHSSYWVSTLGASTDYFDVEGVRTRALHAGDGPVTLMLHGMGGHLENFVYNVVPVSAQGKAHNYAIDLLGHGMNSRPERSYTFDDMIDHVLHFMDAIGQRKVSLVGLSLGSLVAAWIALRHPERVERMALTTGFGMYLDGSKPEEIEAAFARIRDSNLKLMRTPTLDTVRDRLRPLAHNPATISEEMVQTRLHIYNQPGAERVIRAFVEDFYQQRDKFILTSARLRQIQTETLVIWGEHNNPPVDYARRAAALIPNAKFHVCANSGHWPHVEAANDYNRVVAEFLLGNATVSG
ncbi:MAG: alpha/beta fold hydrolase [Burkholderiales bacterium]